MDPHVERAVAAFNDHDPDGLMAEMADGGTFTDPLETDLSGAALRAYTRDLFEGFPDLRLDVDRVVCSGEGVTAMECEYVGTHEGPLDGLPPTGNAVAVRSMTVIDVSEGGITHWRDYWDRQAFTDQLGLGFPEVIGLVPKLAAGTLKRIVYPP
jgi:steroid delta-isomerase-like uncharacterized protein